LVATALVATVGDGQQYCKGRQMASALGLTPRQNSSGDKYRLFGISKRGDVYLRTQMIHGARAVVSQARHRDDPLSRWVTDIAKRRHPNVAAVALANKTARMAWAMLRNETNYDPGPGYWLSLQNQEILNGACKSKLLDGKQVEPASVNPGNVRVLRVRNSDWELTRE
jgi:hypothetical protein